MEEMKSVCSNPWCKATFTYTDMDMIEVVKTDNTKGHRFTKELPVNESIKQPPRVCKKCKSFESELSGGVSWTEKKYEGSRFDGMPHEIKYKVTNYKL